MTSVARAMEPLPEPLTELTSLQDAAGALALSGHGILPVIGADGQYHGCVTARAVAEALGSDSPVGRTVADLAELPPLVTRESTLADALAALTSLPGTGLPVIPEKNELIGWITHQSMLNALHPTATSRDLVDISTNGSTEDSGRRR